MRSHELSELADYSEFRLALQARPPRIVHGTLLLLAAVLAAALGWSIVTNADLVVRAPGRVRPVTSPMKVVNAGSSEALSASAGGRVVEVNVREGQEVRLGDVLIRLETERVDNDIVKRRRAIQAGEEELAEKDYAVRRKELHTKRGLKQAEVEAFQIELANLKLEREQAVIRAPVNGIVTVGDVKLGDVLERGKPAVEIAEQAGFRFEAAVPTEEVGHLRVGMPARIKLDAYDYQRYGTVAGTVVFISPDSGVPT